MPRKTHSSGFAAIPYSLMEQADYKTWAVYAVLHRHGWNSVKGCWTSIETIHLETGISPTIVKRSLRWLRDSGWVEPISRPGNTTVYYVKVDDPIPFDPGQKQPRSKLTQVKNDPAPGSKMTHLPGSKMTHKQEPINKNPLTRTHKEGKAGEEATKDPFRLKKIDPSMVPSDLADCADLIVEYWSGKKGRLSTPVFNRICNKLRGWSTEGRKESLEASISSGWGDVFPPRKQNSFQTKQDPSFDWDSLDGVSFFKQ